MLTLANILFLFTLCAWCWWLLLTVAFALHFYFTCTVSSLLSDNSMATQKFSFTVNIILYSFFVSLHSFCCIAQHIEPWRQTPTHILYMYRLPAQNSLRFSNYLFSMLKYALHTLIFTIHCMQVPNWKATAKWLDGNGKKLKIKHKAQTILCLHQANGKIGKVQESMSGEKKLTT